MAHRHGGAQGLRNARHGEELADLVLGARGRDTHVGAVVFGRSTAVVGVIGAVWKTFLLFGKAKEQQQRKGKNFGDSL